MAVAASFAATARRRAAQSNQLIGRPAQELVAREKFVSPIGGSILSAPKPQTKDDPPHPHLAAAACKFVEPNSRLLRRQFFGRRAERPHAYAN